MLFILEGPDGAGKTTLAEQLLKRIEEITGSSGEYVHRGPIEAHPLIEYERSLDTYLPGSGQHLVCDRWHLGELIYGPLLRGESKLTTAALRHIEMYLVSRGAVLIHVQAEEQVMRERLRSRGDELIDESMIAMITSQYFEIVAKSLLWKFGTAMLFTTEIRDVILDGMLSMGLHAERKAFMTAIFPSVIGHTAPGILLVGQETTSHPNVAMFPPYPETCAEMLLTSLPQDVVEVCAVANPHIDLRSLWISLDEPQVVAMGDVADKQLSRVGIGHGNVAHPLTTAIAGVDPLEYGAQIRAAAVFQADYRPVISLKEAE